MKVSKELLEEYYDNKLSISNYWLDGDRIKAGVFYYDDNKEKWTGIRYLLFEDFNNWISSKRDLKITKLVSNEDK